MRAFRKIRAACDWIVTRDRYTVGTFGNAVARTVPMSIRGRVMRNPGITCARLMEESEFRIADIAREGRSVQGQVAQRILDDTRLYHHWEAEHVRLMRAVAAEPRLAQSVVLRRAAFGLIHRKA